MTKEGKKRAENEVVDLVNSGVGQEVVEGCRTITLTPKFTAIATAAASLTSDHPLPSEADRDAGATRQAEQIIPSIFIELYISCCPLSLAVTKAMRREGTEGLRGGTGGWKDYGEGWRGGETMGRDGRWRDYGEGWHGGETKEK